MLPSKRIFLLRPKLVNQLISVVAYSRKSDFRNKGPYKIVKSDDVVDGKYLLNKHLCFLKLLFYF